MSAGIWNNNTVKYFVILNWLEQSYNLRQSLTEKKFESWKLIGGSGPMGGACGSSCQAGEGIGLTRGNQGTVQDWREVSSYSTSATTIGAWARRTGSGIPVDYTSKLNQK